MTRWTCQILFSQITITMHGQSLVVHTKSICCWLEIVQSFSLAKNNIKNDEKKLKDSTRQGWVMLMLISWLFLVSPCFSHLPVLIQELPNIRILGLWMTTNAQQRTILFVQQNLSSSTAACTTRGANLSLGSCKHCTWNGRRPHTPLNAGRSTQDSASNSTSRASKSKTCNCAHCRCGVYAPQREITEYLWGEKRILSVQVHQCQELSNIELTIVICRPAYATDIKRSQKISAMPIGCYPSIYLMADASWISMEQWNPRKTSTTPALHFPNLLWSKDKQRLSRLARSLERG